MGEIAEIIEAAARPGSAAPDPSPPARLDDDSVTGLLESLEELLGRLEQVPGPGSEMGLDAAAALSELYGEALARILSKLAEAGGEKVTAQDLAGDELIGHLLVLHGLHPDPVERRVGRALDDVRGQLGEDGDAELTDITDGVAHVRVTASGCGSEGLGPSVADLVLAAAPELAGVDPETVKPAAAPLIPLESLLHKPSGSP